MTMAGRETAVDAGVRLCDVPLPDQSRGDDDQAGEVGEEHQHSLFGADRWHEAPSESWRGEALRQRRGVLVDEEVADPLVSAAVETVDETHGDDLDCEHVDEANAKRR